MVLFSKHPIVIWILCSNAKLFNVKKCLSLFCFPILRDYFLNWPQFCWTKSYGHLMSFVLAHYLQSLIVNTNLQRRQMPKVVLGSKTFFFFNISNRPRFRLKKKVWSTNVICFCALSTKFNTNLQRRQMPKVVLGRKTL